MLFRSIHVGLGTGGKAQQFAQVMAIGNAQKEMLQGGKVNLVDDQKLFNTASRLVHLTGYKNADEFFNDPSARDPQTGQLKYPPPPPQPSPEVVKAQSQAQLATHQAQLDERKDQRKAQIEATQAQADIVTQNKKTEAEIYQMQLDYQLKRDLMEREFQLKEREDQRKHEMHEQEMAHRRELHQHTLQVGAVKLVQGQQAHEQKMEQWPAQ